jgi:hypothetical protein
VSRQPTDSSEVPDPEVGQAGEARRDKALGTQHRPADDEAIGRAAGRVDAEAAANDKRGADVERRYGFVWRGKLWRVNPKSVTGMKKGRKGWGGSKPSRG